MHKVLVDGETLTIEDVVRVARENAEVAIPERVIQRMKKSRGILEKLVSEDQTIYGVNTGFGVLSNVKIEPSEIRQLQSNLIRSHSAGVGKPLDTEIVRAMMLLRANTLAKGYSGVRPIVVNTLTEMLNRGVHPLIPAKGSVGASGDLAPLSHMILVLFGEGKAEYHGKILSGKEAMKKARIELLQLQFKEGIALINGTQLMTAIGALAVYDAENLIKTAEIAAAMSLEALLGVSDAFDERIHKARPHVGQIITAENIRNLTKGSRLIQTGKEAVKKHMRPQDPYSSRCVPQVLGAARDALSYAKAIVNIEINSATDNPLVFEDGSVCLSAGNFHGQPISLAMDVLGIALSIVGNFSERRTARLVDDNFSNGLPAFLLPPNAKAGLNSGLMNVQYTSAALASENKILAHPACVDSIPTSANFEDFVSMGVAAAEKVLQILENARYIVSAELLCAAQGIEFRGAGRLGKGTKIAYKTVRREVPMLKEDRVLGDDIEKLNSLVKERTVISEIEESLAIK